MSKSHSIISDLKKFARKILGDFLLNYGKVFVIFISVILLFLCLYIYNILHTTNELRVTFFDVGQGDAIFIESPTHKQLMIDAGANDIILRRLNSEMNFFDRGIDVALATHPDADHITGFIPTLEKYNVRNFVETYLKGHTKTFDNLENEIEKENTEKFIGRSGDVIDLGGGVILTIIYPFLNTKAVDTNDASLVALLTYKDKNFLFTGDLPIEKENEILNSNLVPRNITVLKVGHHGSKTSSSDKFINYLKPTYSILSVGKDNRYGHPAPSVIEILKKYESNVMSTIYYGSVTFVTDGNNFSIETEK